MGTTVGRYVVLGQLGSGAMGIVLRAYDPRLEREVALKILRPDALSTKARTRLLREARAMARLNHPNVVGLFDAEIDDVHGVVLTMELVDGGNLREWLQRQPAWTAVLDRFVAAGRGLAAAHDAGLLHRDFKPANVLLGRDGRVRVTDFGLALAASSSDDRGSSAPSDDPPPPGTSRSGAATRVTEHGHIVGTLAYMAPEQHHSAELTAAADQFAFCASLWHALSGALPFDAEAPGELVVQKAEHAIEWPASRPVPARVVDALRRGLSARPQERWSSMQALLDELDRATTRGRRLGSVAIGATLLGLTAWVAASAAKDEPTPCQQGSEQLESVWGAERQEGVRDAMLATGLDYAPQVEDDVTASLDRYAEDWTASYTDNCLATHVRREQSAEAMDLRMSCLSRARAGMDKAVEMLAAGTPASVDKAYAIVGGLDPVARCDDPVALRTEAPLPSDPETAQAVVAARRELAEIEVLARAGLFDNASTQLDKLAESTASLEQLALTLEIEVLQARLIARNGQHEEAAQMLARVVPRALGAELRKVAASAANHLVFTVGVAQRRHEAADVWVAVAEGLVDGPGAGLDERATFFNQRGSLRNSEERYVEAEADYRTSLDLWNQYRGPGHINDANIIENIAGALYNQGKLEDAEVEMKRAIEISSAVWGPRHPGQIKRRFNHALLVQGLDRLEDAESLMRGALEDAEAVLGRSHETTTRGLTYLALVLQRQERLPEATDVLRSLLQRHIEARGEDHLQTALTRIDLGRLLKAQADYVAAEAAVRRGLASMASLGEDHVDVLSSKLVLADIIRLAGRPADAIPILEGVVAGWAKIKPNSGRWADAAFSPRPGAAGDRRGHPCDRAGAGRPRDRARARRRRDPSDRDPSVAGGGVAMSRPQPERTATYEGDEPRGRKNTWARLLVVHPPELAATLPLDPPQTTIGRDASDADQVVEHATVSRRHLSIRRDGLSAIAVDQQSRNGTWINGVPAGSLPRALSHGDVIRMGEVCAVLEVGTGDAPTAGADMGEHALPGRSSAVAELRSAIAQAAADPSPVLISGESGTGKEFAARELHRCSGRSGPLVVTNCAALSATLIDSQLFGHEKGAFTGAVTTQPGLFRAASTGSLFLDEIGEVPLEVQPKLLRAVELGEVTPLGDTKTITVDVRIIAATNRSLAEEVQAGRFRRDLYARLSLFQIVLPPLRERRADVPMWLERLSARWRAARDLPDAPAPKLSAEAMETVLLHRWPENLRGLDHLVHALATGPADETVTRAMLPEWLHSPTTPAPQPSEKTPSGRPAKPDRETLEKSLRAHDWNVAAVAAEYERDRKQIYRWIEAYGIQLER